MAHSTAKNHRIQACDGLRAIALLAVIAFHVWPNHVPGGYFGVNIFFVLAGFFVSQKIYNSLEREQRFDLWGYYQKRIRRLYAPLIPLLIATSLWTYFVQPNVYTNVRQSIPSALLFFNNIYQLLGNRSYFTTHGSFQPFTHMWSLALEVQFYLLYPLLVLLLWRVSAGRWRKTSLALLGLSVLSAALMAIRYQAGIDLTPIYYSLLCRLFAFTIGGAAAFHYLTATPTKALQARIPRHLRDLMAVGCLVFIVITFFFADYQNRFVYQGGMFLYSLVTAFFITLIYHEDLSVARLLSARFFRILSQRSYSYYIWQYCLLVLGNSWYAFSTTPIALRYLEHFCLLLVIGEVSYRFFEQGVITFSNQHYRRLLFATGILFLVFMQFNLHPIVAHTPPSIPTPTAPPNPTPDPEPVESSEHDLSEEVSAELQQIRLVAIGDSVLDMAADRLKYYLPECIIDAEISRQMWHGTEILEALKETTKSGDAILISLGTNGDFKEGLLEQYYLLAGGKPVIFLTTVMPESWEQSVNNKFRRFAATHSGVYIADWYALAKNHPEWFYSDGTHPRPEGVQQLVELILQKLEELMADSGASRESHLRIRESK